jgi:hypothetical protein
LLFSSLNRHFSLIVFSTRADETFIAKFRYLVEKKILCYSVPIGPKKQVAIRLAKQ